MAIERMSYFELKDRFLENYYATCRDHRAYGKLTLDEIILDVHEDLFETLPSTSEKLMVSVISLALTGGWFPELERYCRERVEDALLSTELENVVVSLPPIEKIEFLRDLRVLKII